MFKQNFPSKTTWKFFGSCSCVCVWVLLARTGLAIKSPQPMISGYREHRITFQSTQTHNTTSSWLVCVSVYCGWACVFWSTWSYFELKPFQNSSNRRLLHLLIAKINFDLLGCSKQFRCLDLVVAHPFNWLGCFQLVFRLSSFFMTTFYCSVLICLCVEGISMTEAEAMNVKYVCQIVSGCFFLSCIRAKSPQSS